VIYACGHRGSDDLWGASNVYGAHVVERVAVKYAGALVTRPAQSATEEGSGLGSPLWSSLSE
jgi:hypothetical protein